MTDHPLLRFISRRRFLRNSLAGGAGVALSAQLLIACGDDGSAAPQSSDAATLPPPDAAPVERDTGVGTEPIAESAQIVVVGAGLAGLTAARDLVMAGYDVRVVEARARVGGRTVNQASGGGHIIEGGGQWVGPTQTAVLALSDELGIETFSAEQPGDVVYHFEGFRFTEPASTEPSDPDARDEFRAVRDELEIMMKTVPLDAPWTAVEAAAWDATTISAWLTERTSNEEVLLTFSLDIASALGDPEQISLLWYLFYLHSAGGVKALSTDAQSSRFVGGAQEISLRMATMLGDRLYLNAPVVSITQPGDDVGSPGERNIEVKTARGTMMAEHVIVAMMPKDMTQIAFSPALPAMRSELNARWNGEPGIKIHLVYEKPFWRDAGLSGVAISDFNGVVITFDNSPPDASNGVLLAFVDGQGLPDDAAARQAFIVAQVERLLGAEAASPSEYHEMDWSGEMWTAGCTSPLGPGVLTSAGPAIREPVGGIHWAGTETATVWNGYMDGAVRSGHRAAEEILGQ